MKNPTPLQVVLLSSFLLAIIAFSGVLIYSKVVFSKIDFLNGFFVLLLVGIFSFIIFFFMLQRFIYRKIKVIYKSIYDFKVTKESPKTLKINMSSDVFETQAEAVEQWAETKNRKLTNLNKWKISARNF